MKRQRRNDFFVGQVADRLAKARRRHNLTQEVVRFDTGLNVGRIEAGCSDITLSTLADLCDYYDISPGHYKIFCVNVKYGIQYEFRIFLFNRFAK